MTALPSQPMDPAAPPRGLEHGAAVHDRPDQTPERTPWINIRLGGRAIPFGAAHLRAAGRRSAPQAVIPRWPAAPFIRPVAHSHNRV